MQRLTSVAPVMTPKLFCLAILVGVLAGLEAIAFYLLLDLFSNFFGAFLPVVLPRANEPSFFDFDPVMPDAPVSTLMFVLVPVIGGLISGVTTYKLIPEAPGGETDVVIGTFHRRFGVFRARLPAVRALASSIFIGAGNSAGREGPIAQIAASTASVLASKLGASTREREILVVAGMCAGIGGLFRSPLGGVLFGIEVLYKRDYEVHAFVPAVIATFTSFTIFSTFIGWEPMLSAVKYTPCLKELPLFALVGLISGVMAKCYIWLFGEFKKFFERLPCRDWLKPAVGGLIVGVLSVVCFELLGHAHIMGPGYGLLQLALSGEMFLSATLYLILLLIVLKMVATAASLKSNGSGGAFAPSVTIGGLIGGFSWMLLSQVFPDAIVNPPGVYALIGMASFFGAAANVPLAAIVMAAEITWDYNILAPAIIATTLSYMLTINDTIYGEQLTDRSYSPIHMVEHIYVTLYNFRVGEVLTPEKIYVEENATVEDALAVMVKSGRIAVPVVDEKHRYIGIVDVLSVSSALAKDRQTRVRDIVHRMNVYVVPDTPLLVALGKMLDNNLCALPVIDPNTGELLGEITYEDAVKALYYKLGELGLVEVPRRRATAAPQSQTSMTSPERITGSEAPHCASHHE